MPTPNYGLTLPDLGDNVSQLGGNSDSIDTLLKTLDTSVAGAESRYKTLSKVKPVDTARANSNGYTVDPHLSVSVTVPNVAYEVQVGLFLQAATVVPGFRFQFGGGSTDSVDLYETSSAETSWNGVSKLWVTPLAFALPNTATSIFITGIFVPTTNVNFSVMWGAMVNTADTITLQKYSFIRLVRV